MLAVRVLRQAQVVPQVVALDQAHLVVLQAHRVQVHGQVRVVAQAHQVHYRQALVARHQAPDLLRRQVHLPAVVKVQAVRVHHRARHEVVQALAQVLAHRRVAAHVAHPQVRQAPVPHDLHHRVVVRHRPLCHRVRVVPAVRLPQVGQVHLVVVRLLVVYRAHRVRLSLHHVQAVVRVYPVHYQVQAVVVCFQAQVHRNHQAPVQVHHNHHRVRRVVGALVAVQAPYLVVVLRHHDQAHQVAAHLRAVEAAQAVYRQVAAPRLYPVPALVLAPALNGVQVLQVCYLVRVPVVHEVQALVRALVQALVVH
jgi:hypothetical protein